MKLFPWMGILMVGSAGMALGWAAGEGMAERGISRAHTASALSKVRARSVEETRSAEPVRMLSSTPAPRVLEWMSRPPEADSEDEKDFREWKRSLQSDPAAGFVYLRDLATGWIAEGREVEARTALQWMKDVKADPRVLPFLSEQARLAMKRPREGVDSGVLTAVALAETLEHLGASESDLRRLVRDLVTNSANPADAAMVKARLGRGIASENR